MRRVMERYRFLEKHSRVLVAVSGGIDSVVLLALLNEYNDRYTMEWYVHACHIDHGFPETKIDIIKKALKEIGAPYTIINSSIYKKLVHTKNPCFACARERRKKLLETAQKMNIFNIALAHHKQDAAETLVLNMIYNGEFSTLTPKQSVIQGRFYFIRPLYYLEKKTIRSIAQIYKLSVYRNNCAFFKDSKREEVRRFLETIRKDNPDVYKNIFRSLSHVRRAYMP
jgi:tRNA 2-thiocytidine biosynthesis protein TtcA